MPPPKKNAKIPYYLAAPKAKAKPSKSPRQNSPVNAAKKTHNSVARGAFNNSVKATRGLKKKK